MSHPGSTSVPPRHLICDVLCNGGIDEGPADRLATEIIDVLRLEAETDNSDPAFPTKKQTHVAIGNDGSAEPIYQTFGGLTKREYFAAAALIALRTWTPDPCIELGDNPASCDMESVVTRRARWAFAQADAMLAASVPITPVDLREGGVADIQPASALKHSSQSSDAEGHRDYSDAPRRDSGDPEPSASVPNEPTPGPWAYEYIGDLPPGRTRSDRPTIAIVGDFRVVREGRGYDLHSSDEDDARLIAAAPETAAERDRLREHSAGLLSAIDQFEPDIDDYDDEVLFRDLVKPALERLRAALSCAEGGAS